MTFRIFAAALAAAMAGCNPHLRLPNHPGLRIVSLAPSVTETLFALSAGPEVVGVSTYCDYPPQVKDLPKTGTFLTPNVEAIVALRPDVVVGLESSANEREIRSLRSIGLRFILVRDDSLGDIEKSIGRIGDGIGERARADEVLAEMKRHFADVEDALRDIPPTKVLMLVGHQPMVAVGSGTFLDQLILMAHGKNIASGLGRSWPRLSIDYVIASAPDVIIDGQMGSDSTSPGDFWEKYRTIPAVASKRLYGFDENPMLRPGPRVWQSLALLASYIHPEARLRVPESHPQTGTAPLADVPGT